MQTSLIDRLERHLPQLLSIGRILIGRERGCDEVLEDWLSTTLESETAAAFASLSDAHLFASCCAYFLMTEASLEISDMDHRVEIAIAEVARTTREREEHIRQILLPAGHSLKE